MSVYPMRLEKIAMKHQGGTKQYSIYLIVTADGRALQINKWGKIGAFGEIQTLEFDSETAGRSSVTKKEKSRFSGGYRQEGPTRREEIVDEAGLRDALGLGIWAKMGKSAINHLDPEIDTSGMREADPNRLDEDGRLTGKDKPRGVDLSEQLAAQKEAERLEAERVLKANPNFGRFA